MDELTPIFGRLLIHYFSSKHPAISRIFISEPSQETADQRGHLFGLIEINLPQKENLNLVESFIKCIEQNYYSSDIPFNSLENYFEQILKITNEQFLDLIKQNNILFKIGTINEESILEKINVLIGVVKNEELIISPLGNVNAYLFRQINNKYQPFPIIQNTEQNFHSNDKNLFSNVILGQIKPTDCLFFSNSNFLNFVSVERINKVITDRSPNQAVNYLKNLILNNENNNFASLIVKFKTSSPVNSPAGRATQTSIDVLNKTTSTTSKLLTPSISNLFLKIINNFPKYFKHYKNQTISYLNQRISQQTLPSPISQKKHQAIFTFISQIIKSLILALKNIVIKIYRFLKLLGQAIIKALGPKIIKKSQPLINKVQVTTQNSVKKLGFYKKISLTNKILLGLLIIFSVTFGLSIVFLKQHPETEIPPSPLSPLFQDMEDKLSKAESSLIYNNDNEAEQYLIEAQNILNQLPINTKREKELYNKYLEKNEYLIAKLKKITIVEEFQVVSNYNDFKTIDNTADFSGKIISVNPLIILVPYNQNNILIHNIDNATDDFKTFSETYNKTSLATFIEGLIIIKDDQNQFFKLSPKDSNPTKLGAALPNTNSIKELDTYNGRLYLLSNDQIFRYQLSDNDLIGPNTWLRSNFDLTQINTMAIDGEIWFFNKNNYFTSFRKGEEKEKFEIDLKPGIDTVTKSWTSPDGNYLFLLDPKNQRILVYTKEGKLQNQYYASEFDNLKDLTVDENNKKIYVLNGTQILTFGYNF